MPEFPSVPNALHALFCDQLEHFPRSFHANQDPEGPKTFCCDRTKEQLKSSNATRVNDAPRKPTVTFGCEAENHVSLNKFAVADVATIGASVKKVRHNAKPPALALLCAEFFERPCIFIETREVAAFKVAAPASFGHNVSMVHQLASLDVLLGLYERRHNIEKELIAQKLVIVL